MDNENKVTPSEPLQSERELAERIRLHIETVTGFPVGHPSVGISDEIAHLIHAENERQREVLRDAKDALLLALNNQNATTPRFPPMIWKHLRRVRKTIEQFL